MSLLLEMLRNGEEAKRSFAGSSLPSFLSRKRQYQRGKTKFRGKFFAKLSFKKAAVSTGRNEVSQEVLC